MSSSAWLVEDTSLKPYSLVWLIHDCSWKILDGIFYRHHRPPVKTNLFNLVYPPIRWNQYSGLRKLGITAESPRVLRVTCRWIPANVAGFSTYLRKVAFAFWESVSEFGNSCISCAQPRHLTRWLLPLPTCVSIIRPASVVKCDTVEDVPASSAEVFIGCS